MINAQEESKEVILTNLVTTEVEKVSLWSIVKDNLIVNDTKIQLHGIRESRTGYELFTDNYLLEVI